jgi:oligopeptidase A
MTSNPLLHLQFQIPFDQIQVEHIEPAIKELLEQSRQKLEALAADPAPRTYENTMLALEEMTEGLDYAMGIVRHLEGVRTTPELRAAFNAVEPLVSEFYSSIPLHDGLWKQLKAFCETAEFRTLIGARKRFVEKTIDSFRRHGADLAPEDKAKLAAFDVELSKITTKFGENVLDSTNQFELIVEDEALLAGLPPTAVAAARQSAQSKGREAGWRFTLQAPSYIALMTYLDDRPISVDPHPRTQESES